MQRVPEQTQAPPPRPPWLWEPLPFISTGKWGPEALTTASGGGQQKVKVDVTFVTIVNEGKPGMGAGPWDQPSPHLFFLTFAASLLTMEAPRGLWSCQDRTPCSSSLQSSVMAAVGYSTLCKESSQAGLLGPSCPTYNQAGPDTVRLFSYRGHQCRPTTPPARQLALLQARYSNYRSTASSRVSLSAKRYLARVGSSHPCLCLWPARAKQRGSSSSRHVGIWQEPLLDAVSLTVTLVEEPQRARAGSENSWW